MNKLILYSTLLMASSLSYAVDMGCHIKTKAAIACTTQEAAAIAFQQFGFNTQLIAKDYNLQLIYQAGCSLPFLDNYKTVDIELMSEGQTATRNGWINVSDLLVNHNDFHIVASAYISGKCKKFEPPNGNQGYY